jgi:hypothetical protein
MRVTTALVLALAFCGSVRAEHAKINLDVAVAGGEQVTAHVDQTPPESGKNPRPVIHARAGQPIRIHWILTNVYPNKTLQDVVVHFFIAPQEKVGQRELPTLGDDVVLETAFDMDFQPGGKAGGRQTIRIDEPGVYLVRVETRQTQSDHEHFSAIDLVIDPR